ncbi:BlaI/MecI/CopY family transcriptional regulator [Caulobacter sp. HMWF025]|uniref:BlaI/MecI/CopY family transcriptional regulator n=2 Tax=unclassified Caulobacter TaxID=2648921 RepID=UPI000D33ADCA|nr:BlaI/MecI/CopY family transcriptional regulator [Caulobacter sp. HMWF025]PTT07110.1 BlaI/MecI/CopY family transcriptional regulator [Caulobacter sp. HMWF025]
MHITAAESQVMEALWRREPLTADELVAEVGTAQAWGEATVKTLINRLLKKKAIKSERADGRHGYRPLVARSAYVQAESQGLLDRLFEGQLAPMISHFAQHRALKDEEIARLKRLIEELEDGR